MIKEDLQVLKRIEEQAKKIFLPIVGGVKGQFLENMVERKQPTLILEIGTLVGYSTILMARNLKKGKVITIEISEEYAKIAKKNIKDAGLNDKVKILIGNAIKIIPSLKEKFDLVFIDAAKEEYLSYLKLLEKNKNISKGSIIIADNAKIFASSMKDYLHYVRNSGSYDSKFYDFKEDGMEVSVKI